MNAKSFLVENGVKLSVQRIALMEYLLKNRTHPTVEEMFCALSPKIPTLSRTTVYNTMKLFVKHGVASMINIEEKSIRFDLKSHPHGHFFCNECNQLFDFELKENMIDSVAANLALAGCDIESTQINCRGICNKCKQ